MANNDSIVEFPIHSVHFVIIRPSSEGEVGARSRIEHVSLDGVRLNQ
jgi:hypothetical protein